MPTPKNNFDRERIVSAAAVEDDASFELKLRPRRLQEFIGQEKVKANLAVAIEAARSRGEALDHVLLYGPPGLGKTTLATIIANEMGAAFQQTSGPVLQIKGDLTAVLTNLRDKQVLFIDEVHRLQPVLEELLYSALEDYKLDIMIGQGPSARTHTIDVRPFTFVGATTRAGLLSSPLRSRFGIVLRLEFYTHNELAFIISRSAEILGVEIDDAGAREIAGRCRGTPRIANRLLRRVRDYAQVRANGRIDLKTAQAALAMLEVDRHGFDEIDRKLLLTIIEKYQGGPVGVNTLAAALAEEPDAIEEIYEPFLIQIGFLDRTPRGRVATQLAYEHFGIPRGRFGMVSNGGPVAQNDRFLSVAKVSTESAAMRHSITAAVQRNKVYRDEANEQLRAQFRSAWESVMRHEARMYGSFVSDDEHCEAIRRVSESMSEAYPHILFGGRLRYGTAQKAFNVYLKYLWRLGQIPSPPHCPVDREVLQKAGIEATWTTSDSEEEYRRWIAALRSKANPLSLAEWEYQEWQYEEHNQGGLF